MTDRDTHYFKEWLARNGAEVLAPTNAYELVRFRARGAVHIIYTGRRGVSMQGFAHHCYTAFKDGSKVDMGVVATQRTQNTERKAALFARDGRGCFYCADDMDDEDMTVEHLIALDKGGPNRLENLALAHKRCNSKASNLPLAKKIALRDTMRPAAQPAQKQGEDRG